MSRCSRFDLLSLLLLSFFEKACQNFRWTRRKIGNNAGPRNGWPLFLFRRLPELKIIP